MGRAALTPASLPRPPRALARGAAVLLAMLLAALAAAIAATVFSDQQRWSRGVEYRRDGGLRLLELPHFGCHEPTRLE